MSDFKSLNGYNVKDEVARNGIESINQFIDNIDDTITELNKVDIVDSTYISGNMWFSSGDKYSDNVITIDLSQIENSDKYNYISLIGHTDGVDDTITKLEIPKLNDKVSVSPQFPCLSTITGNGVISGNTTITSTMKIEEYRGSIAFRIKRVLNENENKIQIQAFNTPFHQIVTRILVTDKTSGDTISDDTTTEILYDKNGAMIGQITNNGGLYTELKGIGLSVY